jgi:transposase
MSLPYRSVRFPHDLFHQGRTVSEAASSGSRACIDKVDLDKSACMNLVSGWNESNMTLAKLGIDIAKHSFEVALIQGEKLRHKTFENAPAGFDAMTAWLTRQGVSQGHAVMEATGTYGEDLALYLYHAGHRVSVVNPARIKAFGQSELQRNKNDRMDAASIARFAVTHDPEAWTPPPEELRQLQGLARHLDDLIAQHSQWQQRLTESRPVPAVQTSLQTLVAVVEDQMQQVQQQIRNHVTQHPELARQQALLTSIPGIGEITATRLLAEMAPLERFQSARQAAAYTGLTPKHHESGSSVRGRTRLSKIGNARVRKALYWPAIAALRCNPLIYAFGQRLHARGKAKMVVIGAAMRKLVHLAYGVLKTGKPFDEQHAMGAVPTHAR